MSYTSLVIAALIVVLAVLAFFDDPQVLKKPANEVTDTIVRVPCPDPDQDIYMYMNDIPELISDPEGDIVREYRFPDGSVHEYRYRRDREAAIAEVCSPGS